MRTALQFSQKLPGKMAVLLRTAARFSQKYFSMNHPSEASIPYRLAVRVHEWVDGDAAARAAIGVVLHHQRRSDPQAERDEPRDAQGPHVEGGVGRLAVPNVPALRRLEFPVKVE